MRKKFYTAVASLMAFVICFSCIGQMPVFAQDDVTEDEIALPDDMNAGSIVDSDDGETADGITGPSEKFISALNTDIISNPNPMQGGGWNYVYYGDFYSSSTQKYEPVAYRVLSRDTQDYGSRTMLLDSGRVLYQDIFGVTGGAYGPYGNSDWQTSDVRKELNGDRFYLNNGVFTKQEREAIAVSTKSNPVEEDGAEWSNVTFKPLVEDKIFLLDYREATRETYGYGKKESRVKGYNGSASRWYLRSPRKDDYTDIAVVKDDGTFMTTPAYVARDYISTGICPAFNISLSSIVFITKLPKAYDSSEKSYKLTVKDADLKIAITSGQSVKTYGKTVEIPYTVSGGNEYKINQISVLITDKEYTKADATIKYYGALRTDFSNGSPSGKNTFVLPDEYEDTDKVYILAETVYLGDNFLQTDYASNLVEIPIESVPMIADQPSDLELIYGYESGNSLSVTASADAGTNLSYQWYINTTHSNKGGTEIEEANADHYSIPVGKNAGIIEYYYCVVKNNDLDAKEISRVAKVTVSKAPLKMTPPTAKEGLGYNGKAQELIEPGATTEGTILYAVSDNEASSQDDLKYDTAIPTGIDVGTYYVWYKAVGDENHYDTEPVCLTVTINEKASVPYSGYMTPVMEITDETTELYLVKGQSFTLPGTGWTSRESKRVSISKKGLLKAKVVTGKDPVIITDGKREISIYVSQPVMAKKKDKIEAGETRPVVLNYDQEHYKVLWESNNIDVATVSQDGTVTAIAK